MGGNGVARAKIDIVFYDDGGDAALALGALGGGASDLDIRLYCLCGGECARLACEALRKQGAIQSYEWQPQTGGAYMAFANDCVANGDGYIFFLSSRVVPGPGLLAGLVAAMGASASLCGANPLLLEAWSGAPGSVAFMGACSDFQHRLHYLYEGLSLHSPLVAKHRVFQFAHPGALLLRKEDFRAVQGFNPRLDYLAFYDFCLRLGSGGRSFALLPECRASLLDRFDSWKFCGIWNSAMQSGKLRPGAIRADYPRLAQADGLAWRLDPWLNEYPADIGPQDAEPAHAACLQWRQRPDPASLLEYVERLPPAWRGQALELALLLPASLPRVLAYYEAQAALLAARAEQAAFPAVARAARAWQRSRARFAAQLLRPGMRLLQKHGLYDCSLAKSTAVFNAWVEIGESLPRVEPGAQWPRIAIVMPVHDPEPEFLRQAIDSVRAQTYPDWQLCIADDASTNPRIHELLRARMREDARVKVVFRPDNGHISAASNSALELVDAPLTGFLDHDDTLAPEALGLVASAFAADPGLRLVYSDEDHINAENARSSPIFKPDFDSDLFYPGHLSVYASGLARDLHGFRHGFEGSQDFDFALRAAERLQARAIGHIPHILYHWRIHANSTAGGVGAKPYILAATRKALLERAARQGLVAEVAGTAKNNFYNLAYQAPGGGQCSVVFLTDARHPAPAAETLDLISAACGSPEILLQPLARIPQTAGSQAGSANAAILPYAGSGFGNAANAAARAACGEVILFLYAGLKPLPGCRPEQLLFHALRPAAGACGALIWKDSRLVNGGVYPDISGRPFILHQGLERARLADVSWGHFLLTRHVLGISWQCACLRKDVLAQAAYFDSALGDLAMLDLCLRLIEGGLFIVASPFGQWQGGRQESLAGGDYFQARYGAMIKSSGLRNANLRAAPDNGWTLVFQK